MNYKSTYYIRSAKPKLSPAKPHSPHEVFVLIVQISNRSKSSKSANTACKASTTLIQMFKVARKSWLLKLPFEADWRDGCAAGLSIFMSPHKEGLVQMPGESMVGGASQRGIHPKNKKPQPLPLPECWEVCLVCSVLSFKRSFNRWATATHLIRKIQRDSQASQASSSPRDGTDKILFL